MSNLTDLQQTIDIKTAQLERNIRRLGEIRTSNPSVIRELEKHIANQTVELQNLNRQWLAMRKGVK